MISSILSNWYLDECTAEYLSYLPKLNLSSRSYANGTCTCDHSLNCLSPLIIDEWVVPGLQIGCDPMESLLQSTLECLYDVTCINQIMPNNTTPNITFHALKSTLSSFHDNVQSLVNILMVDQLKTNVTYENYYKSCAPAYCTYSLNTRFDKVFVFTNIMGLSGGLTVTLKLIIPFAVKFWQHIQVHRRRVVQPMTNVIS
ncbi:unnamed protein product [Rotaria sp. Silwood1]|nr:unnamed protein product [Rotaria sp. Silwood1]CAF1420886.1 unnamed protein product [Rotaria sp. Silwood1]CAF1424473.1 unnamed protein product [Rotaria sp. Silwood1]CAF3634617.1 unnamed protein product [Rotaria sp. Silwood1]CAF3644368.1 unnamed protein product [Rotaria sp. Silwood1]